MSYSPENVRLKRSGGRVCQVAECSGLSLSGTAADQHCNTSMHRLSEPHTAVAEHILPPSPSLSPQATV